MAHGTNNSIKSKFYSNFIHRKRNNLYLCSTFDEYYSSMKKDRLEIILRIIAQNEVANQAELLGYLSKEGLDCSQGTLSRDIQSLGLRKIRNEQGRLIYTITKKEPKEGLNKKSADHISGRGFISIAFSGQIAVIRTRPGYASGIASDIDMLATDVVLGSVAGDDTILLVPYEHISRSELLAALSDFLPINK